MLIITCILGELSNLILQGSCEPQICVSGQQMWLLHHTTTGLLQDSHTPWALPVGEGTLCLILLSNSSSQANLPPTVCKNGAISVLSIPLLCPAPADLIHGNEGLRVRGCTTHSYGTDHRTAGIPASCHSPVVIEIIHFKNLMCLKDNLSSGYSKNASQTWEDTLTF